MLKRTLLILAAICFYCSSIVAQINDTLITPSIVEGAEKLFGLNFTEAERDSMLDDLKSQLKDYEKIRSIILTNDIPPAIMFNPLPINFRNEQIQNEIIFDNYSATKMPANKNDLSFYSIGQLAHLIKTKQITSLELTKLFIEKLKKYNSKLECVITFTEERAIEQAKKADKEIRAGNYKGMLHGIPYGAKDLIAVKEYKTTWGSVPHKDQVIDKNASIIERLDNAGAILVAKLTLGELAWGDVWFGGKTKNPWDTTKGSSGSSAGPASSTAAGLVPFAIGSETWGSIVSPSTVCGVTGLRPTYGRVSRYGAMALSWSMDKIGPICRNAEDLAIVFNSIYGTDVKDQTLFDFPFNYKNEIDFSKIKIGYLKKDFDKEYAFRKNDSLALIKFQELGAELIPIELPDIPVENISWILSAEAAAAFDELTRSNKDDLLVRQIKNAWPNVFRSSRFIPAVEYINANRIRYHMIQEMERLMSEVDLYLAPSWVGNNLLLTNLTGHPCVVIPSGFSEEGTPTSITLIGKLFDEGTIISAAKKFQSVTEHHLIHPKL
ncbi:MAG: amidase [Bacteroidetes bacterium]|nr:amidase [Bacteroidota bacterium]MBU2506093.1 amidase [Bacteroidota bacterium]